MLKSFFLDVCTRAIRMDKYLKILSVRLFRKGFYGAFNDQPVFILSQL
jgi:hypothetical protein